MKTVVLEVGIERRPFGPSFKVGSCRLINAAGPTRESISNSPPTIFEGLSTKVPFLILPIFSNSKFFYKVNEKKARQKRIRW